MFKALLFDMDGLMTDTETLYWAVNRRIAASYGLTVADETQRKMMGRGAIESMTIFCNDVGITDPPEAVLAHRETLITEVFRKGVPEMPGLRSILSAFAGRLRLAIVTSAPRRFVDIIIPGLKLPHAFGAIQTGDTVTHGKPHPEIYEKGMAQLGIEPEEAIVLEDSSPGARSGKNAGAYVIAVPSEHTASQDFSFADYRAADLFDAQQHIEGLLLYHGRPARALQ